MPPPQVRIPVPRRLGRARPPGPVPAALVRTLAGAEDRRTGRATEGIAVAIVAVTGIPDEVDDLIMPGAFRETLRRRRPKSVHAHEWKEPVGRILHIEEWMPGDPRFADVTTPQGGPWPAEAGALVATVQFNLAVKNAADVWRMVKFYAESGESCWSIGYKVTPGMVARRDGLRVIYGLSLFEVSPVLFGAHPLTRALEVKSGRPADMETKAGGWLLPDRLEGKGAEPMIGNGVMVALYPPADVAAQVARPDGSPADELHVTLAYLGRADDLDTDPKGLEAAVRAAVADQRWRRYTGGRLEGAVGGIGVFPPADGTESPVWVPVDVPGLSEFRNSVIDALHAAGHGPRVASNHGYTPHMTLGYGLDPGEPVPAIPVVFDDVVLVVGGQRTAVPIRGGAMAGKAARVVLEAKAARRSGPVAAGVAVRAGDTGRVLMLQRALDDDDPAGGTWEFPGGHVEDGETARDAAVREWQEETGVDLPSSGRWVPGWVTADGVYEGHVYVVPREDDVPNLNPDPDGRAVINPDDPDGDIAEVAAWWDPQQAATMPALRQELAADPGLWLPTVLAAGMESKAAVRALAAARSRPLPGVEVKGLPASESCAYCGKTAVQRLLWADGRAYIPTCKRCDLRGRATIEDDAGDEVVAVRRIETKAGGADRNRGGAEHLRRWFTSGAGAALISWGAPGDFSRCVAIAGKHMSTEDAKGYCNLRHKEALGIYPATHAKLERAGRKNLHAGSAGSVTVPALGQPRRRRRGVAVPGKAAAVVATARFPHQRRMESKSMPHMPGSYEELQAQLAEAVRLMLFPAAEQDQGQSAPFVSLTATYPDHVIAVVCEDGQDRTLHVPYTVEGPESVSLGKPTPVEVVLMAMPESDRGKPAEAAGEASAVARIVDPALEQLAAAAGLLSASPLEGKSLEDVVRAPLLRLLDTLALKAADVPGMVYGDEPDDELDDEPTLPPAPAPRSTPAPAPDPAPGSGGGGSWVDDLGEDESGEAYSEYGDGAGPDAGEMGDDEDEEDGGTVTLDQDMVRKQLADLAV